MIWLDREAIARRGANLAPAIVDRSEAAALIGLAPAIRAALVDNGQIVSASLLATARNRLTPEETDLHVETAGQDDMVLSGSEPPPPVDLDADIEIRLANPMLLVLFEFLCREIDERDGRNLGPAFVSVAEFWALNSIQCMLEKGTFYSATQDYRRQLIEAREILDPTAPSGFLPSGRED